MSKKSKVAITSGCITTFKCMIASIDMNNITNISDTVLTGIPLKALVEVMCVPKPARSFDSSRVSRQVAKLGYIF